jgi:hypothetical protein
VCLAHCIYFGEPDEVQKMIKNRKEIRQNGQIP